MCAQRILKFWMKDFPGNTDDNDVWADAFDFADHCVCDAAHLQIEKYDACFRMGENLFEVLQTRYGRKSLINSLDRFQHCLAIFIVFSNQ